MVARYISRFYAQLVAYFLPHGLRADREAAKQARMFLGSHIFGPILSTPALLALIIFDPSPGQDLILTAISLYGFWTLPLLLRAGVPYNFLVVLSLVNLHFTILWTCYNYGGVGSPLIIWVLIIPILSVFYIGGNEKMRPVLLASSAASFAVFLIGDTWFSPGQNDVPEGARTGVGLVSTVGTLCYVAAMSIYYARIFDAGVDLENEVQRRRRLAIELRKAVAAANRASASKSEFLARMSHELRTPLNAIIGYAQLLKEEAEDTGDEGLANDVGQILDAGDYLVRLINLILDLSKIEAGRMELHVTSCDIRPLVAELVEARRPSIEAGGNKLRVILDAAPAEADVDRMQLKKMIEAILQNAAQHTEDGTITVSSRSFVQGGRDFFTVSIEDTGPGIPPDLIPTITDTLALSRMTPGGQYGGTGLSLTIAARLCRLMGGYIDIGSRSGHGSRFTITLPMTQRTAEMTPTQRDTAQRAEEAA